MPNDNKSYTAADFRQYAEGRMLPAERHALEKAALEDPFLADALEGYLDAFASHGAEPVKAGLEAAQSALAEKTRERPVIAPVVPMRSNRWWAAAAVIAVLILAGWFLFNPGEKPEENTIAVTPPAPAAPPVTVTPKIDTVTPSGNAAVQESVEKEKARESASLAHEQKELNQHLDRKSTTVAPPVADVVSADDKKAEQLEKVAAEEVNQAAPKKEQAASASVQPSLLLNNFEGRVTDLNNNPLSNATVRIANTNNGVMTNDKGYFNLKSADSVVPVEITVVGYATQNTQLRSTDKALNTIKLPENKSALSEVVVVTKPAADRKKEKTVYRNQSPTVMVQDAEPASGWLEFDNYLQQAKSFTAAQKLDSGDVVLSFLVDRNGKLSSFRIEQSLSEVQDAEAERLIKAGPTWRLLKGRKARATVIIHF